MIAEQGTPPCLYYLDLFSRFNVAVVRTAVLGAINQGLAPPLSTFYEGLMASIFALFLCVKPGGRGCRRSYPVGAVVTNAFLSPYSLSDDDNFCSIQILR